MTLPNSGACGYNGILWTSLYKSKVEVKPVKDSAGRALVARQYTIDVEGHIPAPLGGTTDGTLANMRKLLEMPGGALVFTNKGFGDLQVNIDRTTPWDASYGPWPEVLSWDPIGNDQGCVVRWRCTTLVPCEEKPRTKGILEYCWTETWDIDEHSYTKRVIEGHLTVQATRGNVKDRSIPDNADAYRGQVVPNLPEGFKRVQRYKLSEDKRTLEFAFEDQEIPAALPDGLTAADVHHKVFWRRPVGGKMVAGVSISGTLTVPARTGKAIVYDRIMLIVRSRLPVPAPVGFWGGAGNAIQNAAALALAAIQGQKAPVPLLPNLSYVLENIEIDDEMFGPRTSFAVSVKVFDKAMTSPALLLAASRLWAPVPGTSFASWRASVFQFNGAGKPYAPRGMAGMSFQNQDDSIVDLCAGDDVRSINGKAPGQQRQLTGSLPRQANGVILDPRSTWMLYRLRLRLIENDRVARHKPIGGTRSLKTVAPLDGFLTGDYQTSPGLQPPQPTSLGGSLGGDTGDTNDPGGQGPGYVGKVAAPELYQQVSAPRYTIVLEGYAERIGYGIPTPRLATLGGVAVTQTHQEVSQEQVSSIGGVPIYLARWRITYAVPYAVKEILPMPVNPALF